MKKTALLLALLLVAASFAGCGSTAPQNQVAATTPPVYYFADAITKDSGISVTSLITEPVSCLHDYTLNIEQVKTAESAEVILISGAGLEDFMGDILSPEKCIDASEGIALLEAKPHAHDEHAHDHSVDPHIWLSPENAKIMARNICDGLSQRYPDSKDTFEGNLSSLLADLDALQAYGDEALKDLSTREIITFHDGFSYLAQAFDLTILRSIEEEHGSEASAKDLSDLIALVNEHHLPAIFTEKNGSDAAASVIARETGAKTYQLTTAMGDPDYIAAMRQNIDTLKEALQ